jgi:hypothetical protein
VNRPLRLLGLILALVWVPITSHCLWEDAPGLQVFKCVDQTTGQSESDSNDCDGDVCSVLETADYKVSKTRTDVPPPFLNILFQLSPLEAAPAEAPLPVTAAPPRLPWQFSVRTALSPRAPSFVS